MKATGTGTSSSRPPRTTERGVSRENPPKIIYLISERQKDENKPNTTDNNTINILLNVSRLSLFYRCISQPMYYVLFFFCSPRSNRSFSRLTIDRFYRRRWPRIRSRGALGDESSVRFPDVQFSTPRDGSPERFRTFEVVSVLNDCKNNIFRIVNMD